MFQCCSSHLPLGQGALLKALTTASALHCSYPTVEAISGYIAKEMGLPEGVEADTGQTLRPHATIKAAAGQEVRGGSDQPAQLALLFIASHESGYQLLSDCL